MKKNTQLVNAGREKQYTGKLVNPRIEKASTIVFDTLDEMHSAAAKQHDGVPYYGRRGTPTTFALANTLAEMDNAAGAYIYPCGTAAITASLLAFLNSGDHLLMVDSVYEPTRKFCQNSLTKLGVSTEYYDPLDIADIEGKLKDHTRVIFLESPGSLSMEVQDIPAIVALARQHNIITIIDNTYATPLYLRPLDLGVDVSVQSATKYLNGHSDVMLGVAAANEKHWPTLQHYSYELGFCASVDDIYTTLRGIRTLSVRMREHQDNALTLARWLAGRDEIDHVRHPALASCPGHEFFKRDFEGSNGLFSFVMKDGDKSAVAAMLDNMQHFKMGFSWGGYESLILAALDIRQIRSATKWQQPGPLIRIHVGLEDIDDLKQDLADGLHRYQSAVARS